MCIVALGATFILLLAALSKLRVITSANDPEFSLLVYARYLGGLHSYYKKMNGSVACAAYRSIAHTS